ncbi:MAG: hypothetical protein GHHEDOFH_01139 [Pseudorhodoplanes sp.]|nr:hypothetical protein [Pseudorhodoplanes sp.]
MQRIGQLVLDGARNPLPVLRVRQPVRPVGNKGPGPNMRDPRRERIDVTVGAVRLKHLTGKPVGGDFTLTHQETIEGGHQFRVVGGGDFAVIGDLTGKPQRLDRRAPGRQLADRVVARGVFEDEDVLGNRRACEPLLGRHHGQRCLQGADRAEIEFGIAPLQDLQELEGMRFQPAHQLVVERRTAAGRPERAVMGRAAGAAGDLRQLGGIEVAILIAVELAVGGKRDVIDIEIETHADGIGGYQVIDVARLEQRHLGIAGTRRQRAEHHRGAAALAPD